MIKTELSDRASVVQYLKTTLLSSLSLEEKIEIKNAGRPIPNLSITSVTKCEKREYKRTFHPESYEKTDWLCGCDVSNRLYCFPCLLFPSEDQTEWTQTGVIDLGHLVDKIKKHQNSQAHLCAKLEFNLLGKQDIRQQLNRVHRVSIEKHNEQVKNNRYVLSKIINCIKFCGAFEIALRGHNEGLDSTSPEIFKGLINFSAELDSALKEHLQQAEVVKRISKDVQNDLLECMLSVCQTHIKKEIAGSKFVSVIIEDTSDISNIFQMVIVFRYILANATPVERFWTFMTSADYDAAALADCVENVLYSVLKNPDQLISQSYGGSSVHAAVQERIENKFQYAYPIHCYAHPLNLIISQVTSINTNVRIFFSGLNDIINFFSNSPQRVAILDEVVGNRVPRTSDTKWNFKIKTVYENKEALIECMEQIQSTSRQSDTIVKAGALLRLLNDIKFDFWLTVFHCLMPHIDMLYSQLQERTSDSVTIKRCITEFGKNIRKEREYLCKVCSFSDSKLGIIDRKRKADDTNSTYVSTTIQAEKVCNTIISEMKGRFSFTGHIETANLFSVEQFEIYSSNFPDRYLKPAITLFPFLNETKLKTELEIIYRETDFREDSGAVHLLRFLIDNNLQADFSEIFAVLQIIVTMPMTTTEAERCFSTLKRIKTFLKSTMGQDGLSALAMLSIERQMIQDIPDFNELVIEEFVSKKGRGLQLQYETYF